MNLTREEIMEKEIIYRKQSSRPLSKYQHAINAASQEICITNPGLLLGKRKDLIETARSKIIEEGFQFVKGKSRAKGMTCDDTPKRKKLSIDVRQKRMQEIQEDLRDLKDRIGFKEQRRIAAENVRDYTKCDHLCEQIKSLRTEIRKLEAEYKLLETKSRQSNWYFKKKSAAKELSEQEPPPKKKRKQRGSDISK